MATGGKKHGKTKSPAQDAVKRDSIAAPTESAAKPVKSSPSNKPVWQFVVLFGVFMGVFYAAMTLSVLQERVFPAYLRLNTDLSAGILNLFGGDVTAKDHTLASKTTAVEIRRGCDAIDPTALFVAAVLATPVGIGRKIVGALGGTLALALINLIRIITLFLTKAHYPKAFDLMHLEVWQGLFICLSLVLWIGWALWATKPMPPIPKAAPTAAA